MYQYRTGLGQVWVGSQLPPSPSTNIIWLKPSDDKRVLWEIRTFNIYKEEWEVLTSAALTAEGLLKLIYSLEKKVNSLEELKVVLYDQVQSLTDEEKLIARDNIGAISEDDLPEIVQQSGTRTDAVMSQNSVTEMFLTVNNILNDCTRLPTYDPNTYKLTFKTVNGATLEIDFPIEELGLSYNPETESIEFTNHAGEVESIPVSAFVKEYLGSVGDAIQITIDNNNFIHAVLLKNSINWDNLSKELQLKIDNAFSLEELEKHAVLYDKVQTLEDSQKIQARQNIRAASQDDVNEINQILFTQYTSLTMSRTPTLFEKGVSTQVTLNWSTKFNNQEIEPDSISVKKGSQVLTSDKTLKTIKDSISDTQVYSMTAVIKGITKTASVTVSAYYPMYFGASIKDSLVSSDILSLTKQPIKASPSGNVTIEVEDNEYIWLCVPSNMTINSVKSGGFDVPMAAPITVVVNGKGNYKCYRSANKFVAGTFVGVIA